MSAAYITFPLKFVNCTGNRRFVKKQPLCNSLLVHAIFTIECHQKRELSITDIVGFEPLREKSRLGPQQIRNKSSKPVILHPVYLDLFKTINPAAPGNIGLNQQWKNTENFNTVECATILNETLCK